MTSIHIRILSTLTAFLVCIAALALPQSELSTLYPDYEEDVFMDMDFEANLASPDVPEQARKEVVKFQRKLAEKLKNNYTIDLMREGEVVVVTIPTDYLFQPNDTLFCNEAVRTLTPLLASMKNPYMYKLVVAVHTDDTGSESYRDHLSSERIRTVYDWLMDEIDRGTLSEDLVIVPYSMGSTMPLELNDTRRHRSENRRLEIYFIPGPEMIDKALAGTLN
ncbi:MAG: OmpA family protein [Paramuribaculum sp.]|nr:OmpA family protein [Paramuribaculum sp.]